MKQNCDFVRDGNRVRCRNCDYWVEWSRPELPARVCRLPRKDEPGAPPEDACVRRGAPVREIGCNSCKGEIALPIYGCPIHGECTLQDYSAVSPEFGVVRGCTGCPDRKPVEPPLPSLVKQGYHLAKDAAIDLRAGRPRRSPKRIAEIFNIHCKPCPLYNSAEKACSICGCPVSPDEPELNRIAWASLGCSSPEPKWGPEHR